MELLEGEIFSVWFHNLTLLNLNNKINRREKYVQISCLVIQFLDMGQKPDYNSAHYKNLKVLRLPFVFSPIYKGKRITEPLA